MVMQYLLTQEEYDALRARQQHEIDISRDQLQKLCSEIADTMPIKRPWNKNAEPAPWGCVLTVDGEEWYCDRCPVQKICPNPYKEWSK